MTHDLKTWPVFFTAILDGSKTYELRKADREDGFAVGDYLRLREWEPLSKEYTGRETTVRVSHMIGSHVWGLQPGWVVMGIQEVSRCQLK